MRLKLPLLTAGLAGLAYASPVQPGGAVSRSHSGGGPSTTHKMLPANDGAIIELLVHNGNCTVNFTDMFGCTGSLKEPLGPFKDGQCHGKEVKGSEMPFAQTEAVFRKCKSRSVGYRFKGDPTGNKPGWLTYYTDEDGSGDYVDIGLSPKKLKYDEKKKDWVKP